MKELCLFNPIGLYINLTLLSIARDELNDTIKPCLTQLRVIEYWWEPRGTWKA